MADCLQASSKLCTRDLFYFTGTQAEVKAFTVLDRLAAGTFVGLCIMIYVLQGRGICRHNNMASESRSLP